MAARPLTTARARMLFAPLDEGGRAELVARRLAQAIRLGLLTDGDRLPAESSLASQLGVSPATLREALASLRELRDIGDHRVAIAGAAAALAARRALSADIDALREHAARLGAAITLTERRRADARVHIELAAAAQSPRLTREEMSLWSEIGDLVWLPLAADQVIAVAREHDAIIDAIQRRDPTRARELAEEHVAAETERLLALKLRLTGSAATGRQDHVAGAAGC